MIKSLYIINAAPAVQTVGIQGCSTICHTPYISFNTVFNPQDPFQYLIDSSDDGLCSRHYLYPDLSGANTEDGILYTQISWCKDDGWRSVHDERKWKWFFEIAKTFM